MPEGTNNDPRIRRQAVHQSGLCRGESEEGMSYQVCEECGRLLFPPHDKICDRCLEAKVTILVDASMRIVREELERAKQ